MGPFVLAHLWVYQDRNAALHFLEPLGQQITSQGLGTLSEIFNGDAPFTPRGCIAQAWTVREVLRAWRATLGSSCRLQHENYAGLPPACCASRGRKVQAFQLLSHLLIFESCLLLLSSKVR